MPAVFVAGRGMPSFLAASEEPLRTGDPHVGGFLRAASARPGPPSPQRVRPRPHGVRQPPATGPPAREVRRFKGPARRRPPPDRREFSLARRALSAAVRRVRAGWSGGPPVPQGLLLGASVLASVGDYASSPAQFIALGVLLTLLLLPRRDTGARAAKSYYALLQRGLREAEHKRRLRSRLRRGCAPEILEAHRAITCRQ